MLQRSTQDSALGTALARDASGRILVGSDTGAGSGFGVVSHIDDYRGRPAHEMLVLEPRANGRVDRSFG